MIELGSKCVLVIGLGVTGRSIARFLASRGAKLMLADQKTDAAIGDLPAGATLHIGKEDPAWLEGVDLVIPSPGVPRDNLLLRRAAAARVPILSELEVASRFIDAPIVAVTGTNGKSTVTTMIGEMLKEAGRRPFVGGNLGTPLVEALATGGDIAVVEVSSFQLEWIESFRPHIAVHLNLTDDHLYRYRDLEEYGSFKARLFANQGPEDWAVLNRDDPRVWRLSRQTRLRILSFGLSPAERAPAVWLDRGSILYELDSERGHIDLAGLKLAGRHNLSNAMAASAAALAAGASAPAIERALGRFGGLPHRIEFVRTLDGVSFVDDSKGTNVGAVLEAIAATPTPIILIAGGMDKGGDYAALREPLAERVKLAILIGQARDKMARALAGTGKVELVETLREAVARAASAARRGDTVLLSPGCSSFDQFNDYAERGRVFQELVRAL